MLFWLKPQVVGRDLVNEVLNGYNGKPWISFVLTFNITIGTIFTYGQTGSGKTYIFFASFLLVL